MSENTSPSDGVEKIVPTHNVSTRDTGQGLEQRKVYADGIYAKLQAARGTASLKGFENGQVLFPELKRRVTVAELYNSSEWSESEKKQFLERGFTDEDINSGLIAVIEREFRNPNWPSESFQPEPIVAYINISGTGKIIGGGPNAIDTTGFHPMQLAAHHRNAIQTVADLSAIPYQILEQFGSYENFLKSLGNPDMSGIDSPETNATQIVYAAGLKEFVRAIELQKQGDLGALDTGSHALMASLSREDRLTQFVLAATQHEIATLEEQYDLPAVPNPHVGGNN